MFWLSVGQNSNLGKDRFSPCSDRCCVYSMHVELACEGGAFFIALCTHYPAFTAKIHMLSDSVNYTEICLMSPSTLRAIEARPTNQEWNTHCTVHQHLVPI